MVWNHALIGGVQHLGEWVHCITLGDAERSKSGLLYLQLFMYICGVGIWQEVLGLQACSPRELF